MSNEPPVLLFERHLKENFYLYQIYLCMKKKGPQETLRYAVHTEDMTKKTVYFLIWRDLQVVIKYFVWID